MPFTVLKAVTESMSVLLHHRKRGVVRVLDLIVSVVLGSMAGEA